MLHQFRNIQKLIFLTLLTITSADILIAGTVKFDTTFNGTGYRTVQIGTQNGSLTESVALQSDGKIMLGGYLWGNSGPYDFDAWRVNANGTLDTTFDADGIVITNLGPFDTARKVLIQSDGKTLLGGDRYSGTTGYDFAITRYIENGSLDNSFDGNGLAAPVITGFSEEHCYDMALQPDGKIIMVGTTGTVTDPTIPPTETDIAIIRLNTDGSLDTTFNGTGKLIIRFNGVNESANSVILQNDGKIVIGGFLFDGLKNEFLLMRFSSTGFLDTTFGTNGLVITSVSSSPNSISTLALQNDGKILAGGTGYIARYNSDGSLDTSFGSSGTLAVSNGVTKLLVLPTGKLLSLSSGNRLTRLNQDGSTDNSFNNGGNASFVIPNFSCTSYELAIQTDGKFVIAESCTQPSGFRYSGVIRVVETASNKAFADFDGDGKTDLSIYRPSVGQWWYSRSSDNLTRAFPFGTSSDKIIPADYTGDGKTDVAFWRPSTGQWFVMRSEDFSFYAFSFGATGDVPVPADYDGDGRSDAAVFRESSLTWFIAKSSGGTDIVGFGSPGDKPVNADYDGDGKADIAIFRPSGANGAEWWIRRSSNASVFALQFGSATDKAVPGDFTGDGKTDVAIWRPSTGFWNVLRSEDFSYYAFPFGTNGDVPVPGDYDGDGKTDAGVFRQPGAQWFISKSNGGTIIQSFGTADDLPLPNAFVR